jgi:hypothetical protein
MEGLPSGQGQIRSMLRDLLERLERIELKMDRLLEARGAIEE